MSLQITSFDELDTTRVQELLALFSAWMQEKHPDVELSRGAFHDLVLYFNSVLNAALRENISRVLQSNSLLAITQNPALAEPEIVDKVLANFNVVRETGDAAVGEITVVAQQAIPTEIAAGIRFSAGGVSFFPTATYVGVPPNSSIAVTTGNARVMVPGPNNTYVFKVPVTARFAGAVGNITKGTPLTPDVAPANVSAVFASVDFIRGSDPLTNEEYIARLATGLTAKTIGGRRAFAAFIRAQEAFKLTRHISVIGFGDAEQLRDQRGLFPVSGGGRVDIYVQTHDIAQKTDHTVTATYVGPVNAAIPSEGTIWEIQIDRDLYPGFYAVSTVTKIATTAAEAAAATGYKIVRLDRAFEFASGEYQPDIQNTFEAAFTRFKRETIRFIDTDKPANTSIAPNTEAPYQITTIGMPLIGQMQDFMSSADVRCRAADVVVRAAVPCFTSVGFKIRRATTDTITDATKTSMKQAIVTAVSKIGFSGTLTASVIANAVGPYLTNRQALADIDIFGQILRPDGEVVYVRDAESIAIPTSPEKMVSAKTTVFLTSLEDIEIGEEVSAGFGD